jgi:hypothetical protein
MKTLFLATCSLALMLCLPAWINSEPYPVLRQSNVKNLSTYTEPYHELMKKISAQLHPKKEMAVTVSVWQDSDGNMHFSNQGQEHEQTTQNYEIKSQYTGRLAFPPYWVWGTMSSVWLFFFITSLLSFNWLANRLALTGKKRRTEPANEKPAQKSNDYKQIDYENVNAAKTSPYKILGVTEHATQEEIKNAYRNKVKQYHPDKVAHLGNELQEVARKKTGELNRAYETLVKKK